MRDDLFWLTIIFICAALGLCITLPTAIWLSPTRTSVSETPKRPEGLIPVKPENTMKMRIPGQPRRTVEDMVDGETAKTYIYFLDDGTPFLFSHSPLLDPENQYAEVVTKINGKFYGRILSEIGPGSRTGFSKLNERMYEVFLETPTFEQP